VRPPGAALARQRPEVIHRGREARRAHFAEDTPVPLVARSVQPAQDFIEFAAQALEAQSEEVEFAGFEGDLDLDASDEA